MKNHVKPGKMITCVAGSGGVTSGSLIQLGSLFGVAATSAAEGDEFELATGDVWELPKTSAQAWNFGAKIYRDAATGLCTNTDNSGANTLIGVAVEAAGNPSGKGIVRLNSSF